MPDASGFPLPDETPLPAEARLLKACAAADVLELDPKAPVAERTIRGKLLRVLCLRGLERGAMEAFGIRVSGAVIEGAIDLAYLGTEAAPLPPLQILRAVEATPGGVAVNLTGCWATDIDFEGSELNLVLGAELRASRRVDLSNCRLPPGARVDLSRARLGGAILDGIGPISGPGMPLFGPILRLDGAVVSGDVELENTRLLQATLRSARVGGRLSFNFATVVRSLTKAEELPAEAIQADGIEIGGSLFCRGLTAFGEVRMVNCRVGGSASFTAARTESGNRATQIRNPGGDSLALDGSDMRGGVFLDDIETTGRVSLNGTRIGGQLSITNLARLDGGRGIALDLYGAAIEQAAYIRNASLRGVVNASGAEIRGDLVLDGTSLLGSPRGGALQGVGLRVTGNLRLGLGRQDLRLLLDHMLAAAVAAIENSAARLAKLPEDRKDGLSRMVSRAEVEVADLTAAVRQLDRNPDNPEAARLVVRANGMLGAVNLLMRELDLRETAAQKARFEEREAGAASGDDLEAALVYVGRAPTHFAQAIGRLVLDQAQIGGDLVLTGARLRPHPAAVADGGEHAETVLSLEGAQIGGRIEVGALSPRTAGVIDLRGASANLLDDSGGEGWGSCADGEPPLDPRTRRLLGVRLRLDNFTYVRLPDFEDTAPAAALPATPRDWPARIGMRLVGIEDRALAAAASGLRRMHALLWRLRLSRDPPGPPPGDRRTRRYAFLMRQFAGGSPRPDDFSPQPFDQVVRVLRAAGHPLEADWFARKKQDFRRICRVDRAAANLWSAFKGLCFGHYYMPGRAFATLFASVALGMVLINTANDSHAFVKKRTEVDLPDTTLAQLRPLAAGAPSPAAGRPPPPRRDRCWESDAFAGATVLGLPARWLSRQAEASVMAFDLLLPVVDLKQDQRCEVDTDRDQHRLWATWLALYSLLGLIILPMFLATVTGLLRREQQGADARS